MIGDAGITILLPSSIHHYTTVYRTLDDDEYDEQVDPTDRGHGALTRHKDVQLDLDRDHDFVYSGAVRNFHFCWQNSQSIQ